MIPMLEGEKISIEIAIPQNPAFLLEFENMSMYIEIDEGVRLWKSIRFNAPGTEIIIAGVWYFTLQWLAGKGLDHVSKGLVEKLKHYTDTIYIAGKELPLEEEEVVATLGDIFKAQM